MLGKRKAGVDETAMSKCQRLASQTVSAANKSSNSNGKSCKVKVYVRVRPFKSTESPESEVVQILEEEPRTSLIFDPNVSPELFYFKGDLQQMRDINKKVKKNQLFEFDQVYPISSTNQQVFDTTAKTIIGSILEGFNCSVFAYGATGAGKTYTMLGKENSPGIAYLTIEELLRLIDSKKDQLNTNISVSYIEVYNEEVRDLLSQGSKKLELREESSGNTFISGLKLIPITDTSHLFHLLEEGNRMRSQHPTDSNSESSRSHAVFQVRVRMQEKKAGGQLKLAKLTMIDLAGSERGGATGFKGKQFKEGRAINQSLLALGNCINALADGLKYVPYRDSKLTRILKDSLGGNCRTIMIANISPTLASYEETYNTLKYATRARSIVTTANQNFVSSNLGLGQYRQLVSDLKTKLSRTETESSDLLAWEADAERIMSERVELFSGLKTLDSQKKITEWRLNNALTCQKIIQPDNISDRMVSSIEQWRNRADLLKSQMKEYSAKIKRNMDETQALLNRMDLNSANSSDQTKRMYRAVISSWQNKVNLAMQVVETQHLNTLVKLFAKDRETLATVRDESLPFLDSCYVLLKSYDRVTQNMKSQYESLAKKRQGIKYVSWEEMDELSGSEDKDESVLTQSYFRRLVVPGQPAPEVKAPLPPEALTLVRNVVPAGRTRTTPYKNDKRFVSPLRTLQPTSKFISKSTKSPKPFKAKRNIISALNKENIIEPVLNKCYSSVKSSAKKTPFKSTTRSKLRT